MNRTILRTTTAVAAVSAAALFFPAVASAAPVSTANCAEVSTGTDANGWGVPFNDEAGQAGTHSATNVNDADGSLELKVADGKTRAVLYHSAENLPLATLAGELSFDHENGPAFWQIRLRGANTGVDGENGFATLVSADGGTATEGQWFATRNLGTLPKGTPSTLDALKVAAGPTAVVEYYGVSTEGVPGTTANVDNVKFNGCTTNFKASGPSGEDTGSTGSLGGFGLASLIPGLPS